MKKKNEKLEEKANVQQKKKKKMQQSPKEFNSVILEDKYQQSYIINNPSRTATEFYVLITDGGNICRNQG